MIFKYIFRLNSFGLPVILLRCLAVSGPDVASYRSEQTGYANFVTCLIAV